MPILAVKSYHFNTRLFCVISKIYFHQYYFVLSLLGMKKIELCIFDVDGLLLDTERYVWFKGEKIVGKQMGKIIDDDFCRSMIGKKINECEEEIKEKLGKDFSVKEFDKRLYDYYVDAIATDEIPVKDGVFDLLEFLKENHVPCSVGTCTLERYSIPTLEKVGLLKYFDFGVFGDSVSISKPNPEVYIKSMEHFNIKPENCLIFEDSINGAKAAIDSNANLVLVPDLQKPTDEILQKAFKVVNRIDDIIPIITETIKN